MIRGYPLGWSRLDPMLCAHCYLPAGQCGHVRSWLDRVAGDWRLLVEPGDVACRFCGAVSERLLLAAAAHEPRMRPL